MRVGRLGGLVLLLGSWAQAGESHAPARVPLHDVQVSLTASSVLKDPKNADRYSPAHLLDEDPATLWSEGARGNGVGEWVELGFPPGVQVDAFLVTPGNSKSAALYRANARPRRARLDLTLENGNQMSYALDFPRGSLPGSSLYVASQTRLAVQSARLTLLSVWPGKKYRDLCLGTFAPVFRGPGETFLGQGEELAPTLSLFMHQSLLVFELLPSKESGEPVWLRTYGEVPLNGRLPPPIQEFDLREKYLSDWGDERHALSSDRAAARLRSDLFRLTPAPRGMGYVFDPSIPPEPSSSSANFRIRWRLVDGRWRAVELALKFREETPP